MEIGSSPPRPAEGDTALRVRDEIGTAPGRPRSKHRHIHQQRAADVEPAAGGQHQASPRTVTGTPRAEEGAVARNLPRSPALLLRQTSASHPAPRLVSFPPRLASQLTPAAPPAFSPRGNPRLPGTVSPTLSPRELQGMSRSVLADSRHFSVLLTLSPANPVAQVTSSPVAMVIRFHEVLRSVYQVHRGTRSGFPCCSVS
ncbi:unnamed protein product [Pleuronectes platessa]|uniref:Uncharacterized protein n=1 Tax=Pleuronectes platessa TaxID=8262 RepID=A0A9N7TR19_PLEPL|nr:unnamed protein product [Pleuronectes platessa]